MGGKGKPVAAHSSILNIANKIGMQIIQKSMRATREALEKEKDQLESIQIDLGVDMMTGNVLREKVGYEMPHKEFEKTCEVLWNVKGSHRGEKQVSAVLKLLDEI